MLAQNTAPNWHPNLNFGDSANDDVLELFMNTIRWSDANNAAQPNVSVEFGNLQVGGLYKLQFIVAEEGWNRGWDVAIDGRQVIDDFSIVWYQGGFTKNSGVVMSHTFVARSNIVTAVHDGRGVTTPELTDHNALLQAATLEVLAAPADTDSDGLPDAWENDVFGNLSQTGSGDTDGDGLKNSEEFANYTDPTKADQDKDGLTDSEELKTYNTDVAKADTDGDGLKDGEEVKTHHTDPLKRDTDTDGLSDAAEVAAGSNPLDVPSQFSNVKVEQFTGGDPGEGVDPVTGNPTDGLDFQGTFLYAVNVSTAGAAGKAYDADFTAETTPGVTITAVNNIPAWDLPEYGDSPADDVIEFVTRSIRYAPNVLVRLTGLIPTGRYKMQLFFYEQCCGNRGFNIYADGILIAEKVVPARIQGDVNNTAAGAMVGFEIVARRDSLFVVLDGPAAYDPDDPGGPITDTNAILDGFTLEVVEAPAPAPRIEKATVKAGSVDFTVVTTAGKTYTLEYKASLTGGAWSTVGNPVTATGASTILTDANAAHLAGSEGYWRVKMQ